MKYILLILSISFLAISCTPMQATSQAESPHSGQTQLTDVQKRHIGQKIWQNECGGTINGLTTWNQGEEFPSMGIGHFIWYPKGFNGIWTESFPSFIAFAKASGRTDIPKWLLTTSDCPWDTKADFEKDFHKARLKSLRVFLANSIALQTTFIIQKSQAALPKILAAAPANERHRIQQNYHLVSTSNNGIYALIDYVNFKGEGINPRERYQGKGWGLLQVLQNMRPSKGGQDSARAFAESAKRTLDQRITNAPTKREEQRWRAGWHNRCETYSVPF